MSMYVIRAFLAGSEPAKVRLVRRYATFEDALRAHNELSELVFVKHRRVALVGGGDHGLHEFNIKGARIVKVNLFDVRAEEDPAAKGLPEVKLVVLATGGAMRVDAVLRRWGNAHGWHGHEGGWLYRGGPSDSHRPGTQGCHRTGMQGWSQLIVRVRPELVYVAGNIHLVEMRLDTLFPERSI